MQRLTSSRLRTVLSAIREIGTARDADSFPDQVMAVVGRLVKADSITYNDINPGRRRVVVRSSPALPLAAGSVEYFAEHINEHPVLEYIQKTGYRQALKISDFVSQSELHRRGIYSVVFAPLDTEDQMAFSFPSHPSMVVGVALNRGSRSFDEQDRSLLNLVRPHLTEAYRTAELFGRLSNAFDLSQVGFIVLDEENRVLHLNELAKNWLAAYFDNREPRLGGLPVAVSEWVRRNRLLLNVSDDVPSLLPPLTVAREGGWLSIRYVGGDDGGNGAMLLLAEQRHQPANDLLRTFGLTARETEVLRCVERGLSDVEIAGELGLSPGTVKKHLEHVYRKLGVSSRIAAVARIRS